MADLCGALPPLLGTHLAFLALLHIPAWLFFRVGVIRSTVHINWVRTNRKNTRDHAISLPLCIVLHSASSSHPYLDTISGNAAECVCGREGDTRDKMTRRTYKHKAKIIKQKKKTNIKRALCVVRKRVTTITSIRIIQNSSCHTLFSSICPPAHLLYRLLVHLRLSAPKRLHLVPLKKKKEKEKEDALVFDANSERSSVNVHAVPEPGRRMRM